MLKQIFKRWEDFLEKNPFDSVVFCKCINRKEWHSSFSGDELSTNRYIPHWQNWLALLFCQWRTTSSHLVTNGQVTVAHSHCSKYQPHALLPQTPLSGLNQACFLWLSSVPLHSHQEPISCLLFMILLDNVYSDQLWWATSKLYITVTVNKSANGGHLVKF